MLRGLLQSAGIPAEVIDTVARRGDSLLDPLIDGGAKVVVRATDAERAREIVQSSGVPRSGNIAATDYVAGPVCRYGERTCGW